MLTCEQHQYENKQEWWQQQGDSLVDKYKLCLLSLRHDFSRYLPAGMSFSTVLYKQCQTFGGHKVHIASLYIDKRQ
jgi:hypothetical protein